MPRPARDTAAGRIYNDLRNLARRTGTPTDQVMLEYLLERFLYRVSIHPLGQQHFVLKGGLLLAQFGARRVTRDIDILGRAFPGDEQEIIRRITQIAATAVDDGVTFEPGTLTTVPIRQDDEHHGLRLAMNATLSRARLKLQLDVSFGDPVTSHRGIRLRPLSEAISDLPTRRQAPYTAWRRRQGHAAENHPATFADLVATVTAFADPLATGTARGRTWDPATRTWQAT
jgi:Nucleotidyl transferase AbiEii toxin, Type IV TA system